MPTLSDTLLSAVWGAIIAGAAMVINSFVSNKLDQKKAEQERIRGQRDKDIDEVSKLYEDILHGFNKLIRNEGLGATQELESFYKLDIQLTLISTDEILTKVNALRNAIATQASKLTPFPEEFIPQFEQDYDRRARLERRAEVEKKRKKEWQKAKPELYKIFHELSAFMKKDLKNKKGT